MNVPVVASWWGFHIKLWQNGQIYIHIYVMVKIVVLTNLSCSFFFHYWHFVSAIVQFCSIAWAQISYKINVQFIKRAEYAPNPTPNRSSVGWEMVCVSWIHCIYDAFCLPSPGLWPPIPAWPPLWAQDPPRHELVRGCIHGNKPPCLCAWWCFR